MSRIIEIPIRRQESAHYPLDEDAVLLFARRRSEPTRGRSPAGPKRLRRRGPGEDRRSPESHAPAMNWGTSAGLLRMDSEPTPIPFDLLAAPAQRALRGAGYVILDQLTTVGATELASLHGFGPSAINTLRQVLAEHEMSFAGE
jgi:hypothetical protein